MKSNNGFNIRMVEHNDVNGMLNDLQNNIQINVNGQTMDRSSFYQQQSPRINMTENNISQSSNSAEVVDPSTFFGSSFSGLINQIKKS